jgi:hypothetical protein
MRTTNRLSSFRPNTQMTIRTLCTTASDTTTIESWGGLHKTRRMGHTQGMVKRILFLLLMTTLARCQPKARTVCFLVPESFQGVFCIVEDPKAGVDPVVEAGTVYYKIGTNRTTAVSDTRPLDEWHVLELRYPSGRIVSMSATGSNAAERIVVRGLFATVSGKTYYYCAPEDGIEEAREEADALSGFPVPQSR